MEQHNDDSKTSTDIFSKRFFYIVPFTVPVIVTFGTYAFYPLLPSILWLPLLIIYWCTIWTFTLIYRRKRGGVFGNERFKPTLRLKGNHLWLQYLLLYGPFVYQIPLFVINYAAHLSINMYLVVILAAAINGPSEEIYWRACMDDAGKNAGVPAKRRLVFAPIVFALWHTAFVIHLFPWDGNWFLSWVGIIGMTWISGVIWLWIMHLSGRLVPQCFYHSCANFFSIFPMMLVTVMHFYF